MTRKQLFNEVARKYGTDKADDCERCHGYMDYYAKELPENPVRLLEIGCFKGASMRMWRELFPKAELHTLDIFIENEMPTDIEGLICHKGNQNDISLLESLPTYDVIIDDGSHNAIDVQTSFDYLFKNKLNEGGMYVIEDLHCQAIMGYRFIEQRGEYPYFMPYDESILGKMLWDRFGFPFNLYEEKIAFIYGYHSRH